jgi:hypothetical protein
MTNAAVHTGGHVHNGTVVAVGLFFGSGTPRATTATTGTAVLQVVSTTPCNHLSVASLTLTTSVNASSTAITVVDMTPVTDAAFSSVYSVPVCWEDNGNTTKVCRDCVTPAYTCDFTANGKPRTSFPGTAPSVAMIQAAGGAFVMEVCNSLGPTRCS